MTGAVLSTGPAGRGLGGGAAPGGTAATGGSCHHSHRQKLSTCSHCSRSSHNYLTLSGCCLQANTATKHVCGASPNLARARYHRVVASCGQREPGCLARGASHCLHCSDQGRGSCHSQAVLLLGRKGQDGDLGAAQGSTSALYPLAAPGDSRGPRPAAFRLLAVPRASVFFH